MRYLLFILLAVAAYGQELETELIISDYYPASGTTEFPADSTVWIKLGVFYGGDTVSYAPSTINPSDDIWTLGVLGLEDTVSDYVDDTGDNLTVEIHNLSAEQDCVTISHVGGWPRYFKVWILIDGAPEFVLGRDSLYFLTESTAEPFGVISSSMFGRDTTQYGTRTVKISRQAGSTVYFMRPGETTGAIIISPEDDYSTERRRRILNYTVTDIPEDPTLFKFYAKGSDGTVSDTTKVTLDYTRTKRGVPYGGSGR